MPPNRMWGSVYRASLRHNNLWILNLSAFPNQVLQFFIDNNIILGKDEAYPAIYGDGIYYHTRVVTAKIDDV